MPIPGYGLDTIDQFVGRELGVSEWVTLGQDRIDQFADSTGDH
jgi:acyl dehydratase